MADSSSEDGVPPQVKTSKIDEEECKEVVESETSIASIHSELKDLSLFEVDKVLHNNSNRKTICVTGRFAGQTGVGIVLLEKTPFEIEKLDEEQFFENCALKQVFHNDIYGNYECLPKVELNKIKTTIIHPATDKHIEKYRTQTVYIVDETPDIYQKYILPRLQQEQFTLQWVYNILEHKSETERIVYEDSDPTTGFILLPDLKWDGKTLETLYLLAITHIKDIKSLRDLTDAHLPLLRNIREAGIKAIDAKYSLNASRLRIYLHYHPSFNHLHVHFTYLQYEAPGIYAERSHLLSNVISNIELLPDYYQRVTLPFVVRENDSFFKDFETAGLLKKHVCEESTN